MRPDVARSVVRLALLLLAVPGAASTAAAQNAWKLGLNVSETWDTNVRLARPSSGKFATRASLKLSRQFQGARWQLGFSGSAMKSFFHGQLSPRARGIFYSTGVQFGYQLSERASLSVEDHFKSSYTGELLDFVDVDEDVLLPQTGQKRNHLRGGLNLQVSSLMSASISGTWDTALFQQEELFQPRLPKGDRLAGGLGLSRKLSDESALNLGYTYARSEHGASTANIHSLSIGVSRVLGEFTSTGISIGASRRDATDSSTYAMSGGLAISRQLEHSSVSLRYGRNLGPVFGIGRDVLHDTVRLSGQRQLSRSVSFATSGAFSRNRDPLDSGFSYNAWWAGGSLSVNLFHLFQLNGGYSYFRRTALPGELGPRFEAHRAAVTLGWNTSF